MKHTQIVYSRFQISLLPIVFCLNNALRSPTTGQFGEAMKEHTGTIRVVKFLGEGSGAAALLASAGAGDCKPRLWDAQAGTRLWSLLCVRKFN